MPTVGGNNVAYGSGGYYEAQIVYTVSYPSSTTYEVDWTMRCYYSTSLFDSTNKAGIPSGGDLKGATSYGSKSYSDSSSGTMTYASGTKTGTRPISSPLTLTQEFWVEDLAEGSGGGGRSTVEAEITIAVQPITVPTTAGKPTISAITSVGATQTWADPADWNGDNSSDFDVQIDDNSSFSSPATISVLNANSYVHTGRTGNTVYWVRDRAKNSAGAGAYSAGTSFLTKPGTPTSPSASGITTTNVDLTCVEPAGGAPEYHFQLARDAAFTDLVFDIPNGGIPTGVAGLDSGTQYWYRFAAKNASGESAWVSGTFSTLKGLHYDDGTTLKPSVAYYDDGVAWRECHPYYSDGVGWRQ